MFAGYDITFDHPAYLFLLALIPVIWMTAARSISALGGGRWYLAVGFRSLLLLLFVLALAEVHIVRTSDRLAVIYLIDRSASVPRQELERVVQYVSQSIRSQRKDADRDQAGVISFGGEAALEIVPAANVPPIDTNFETFVSTDKTNLAAALELARAAFPPDCSKRVVIISDGNETTGDAAVLAESMAQDGIGIDVVPVRDVGQGEVAVEKVVTPSHARRASPFDLRVVLNHDTIDRQAPAPVQGKLVVHRRAGGQEQLVFEETVQVDAGKRVFSVREQVDAPGFFTYEARFMPTDHNEDRFVENNTATSFTLVEGSGRVLIVVAPDHAGEFDELADLLRREEMEVEILPSSAFHTNLADLQSYNLIILANVPRTSGEDVDSLTVFSERQMRMLSENTKRLGCGLLMVGGPESFGAGGWRNTPVEEAMPVDFHVQNAKVVPVGALMLVIDSSGSMSGQKIQICQLAAREAVRVLGNRDLIGVVSFDSQAHTIVPLQRSERRRRIAGLISRLGAGGGTDMWPAMQQAHRDLVLSNASIKHMIVLTDGQTQGSGYRRLAAESRQENITVTTVAVGRDADVALLQDMARMGGGKFYRVVSPHAVPRVFMREARRVARPLVYENDRGFLPQRTSRHEILKGVGSAIPPLTGYVLTTPKQNPLVEVSLTAPVPAGRNNPILATWQYGLGRSAALTTDTGQRWSEAWKQWPERTDLLVQLVRWCLRPPNEDSRFVVATDVQGNQIRLVVTALEQDGQVANFLQPTASAIGPNMREIETTIEQTAPGRYEGAFTAPDPGAYFVSVAPGSGESPIFVGVNVGYADEFRSRQVNRAKLQHLANLVPRGGSPGKVIELKSVDGEQNATDAPSGTESMSTEVDVFRRGLPKATSRQPAWHMMIFCASCLLLFDVFNRRVDWVGWVHHGYVLCQNVLGRRQRADSSPTTPIQRLKRRKAEVEQGWRRWEDKSADHGAAPGLLDPTSEATVDAATSANSEAAGRPGRSESPELSDEEPATNLERLLRAKRTATKTKPRSDAQNDEDLGR